MVEWNSGMTTPIYRQVCDYLYSISDCCGIVRQEINSAACQFGVSMQRLAQGDWHSPL